MGILSIFKGLISPKIALEAITANLQNEVGHPINIFQLVYEREKNNMYFEVVQPDNTTKKYLYNDAKDLIPAVEKIAGESLESIDLLDKVVLHYCRDRKIRSNAQTEIPDYIIESYYRTPEGEHKTNVIPIN